MNLSNKMNIKEWSSELEGSEPFSTNKNPSHRGKKKRRKIKIKRKEK